MKLSKQLNILLTVFLLLSLIQVTVAQTVVQSMQTTHNDKILSINSVGQRAGRPFHHTVHFDVSGMTQPQRDSLYQDTVQALGILGITNVPGMDVPGMDVPGMDVPGMDVPGLKNQDADPTSNWKSVTFNCETCIGKGRLEVYGNNITATRKIDSRQDGNHSFPLTLSLLPGDYRLMYYPKRGQKIQSTFTVRVNEASSINVK